MYMHRKLFTILFCIIIHSCGYQALYNDNKKITSYKIEIITKSKEKSGLDLQIMKKSLSERLQNKNAKNSALKLVVSLDRSTFGMGLQKDLTTTTYGIVYDAKYTFYDRKGFVTTGRMQKQSSFDFGQSPYANLVAEETANRNIIESLAADIASYTLTLRNFSRKIYP